ncbi:GDSL esterase/lipase LIP-4 [Phalaenopsis equestris]|uniref:GDSL esterase/lipase LIP-4 n=1 Tax=Phalaenopsis equestris TaxID=78828 RepID=UPI0009E41AF0|nr:GDSL esterase/lipase LIP-4 [Phalaenopsis equestris]
MACRAIMGRRRGRECLSLMALWSLLLAAAACLAPAAEAACSGEVPVIFNFGDSNSDTGGLSAGLGYIFPLPEGRIFFNRSTGRLCDGRLILDFLCESLNSSYLCPYLESLGSDFTNGANFAVAGSATQPRNQPFSLLIQVLQFFRFKSRSLELVAQGSTNLVNEEGFKKAIYIIDIGQNDLSAAFSLNASYDLVIAKIPSIIAEIKNAIKMLHDTGSRNFWIHNTGPLGCLPQKLSLPRKNDSFLDPYGCLSPLNNAAMEFNSQLSHLCVELRSQYKNATIVYTDIYSIKYDLIANSTEYGFESPLLVCCGYGGPPYNYNANITCGNSLCQVCSEKLKYISWDGVHYSEAANAVVASKILSTEYSDPKLNFDYFCSS